jgi:hypothetical protein
VIGRKGRTQGVTREGEAEKGGGEYRPTECQACGNRYRAVAPPCGKPTRPNPSFLISAPNLAFLTAIESPDRALSIPANGVF